MIREISDFLNALDAAERELQRARGIAAVIAQHASTTTVATHAVVLPVAAMHDEPPSRPA